MKAESRPHLVQTPVIGLYIRFIFGIYKASSDPHLAWSAEPVIGGAFKRFLWYKHKMVVPPARGGYPCVNSSAQATYPVMSSRISPVPLTMGLPSPPWIALCLFVLFCLLCIGVSGRKSCRSMARWKAWAGQRSCEAIAPSIQVFLGQPLALQPSILAL